MRRARLKPYDKGTDCLLRDITHSGQKFVNGKWYRVSDAQAAGNRGGFGYRATTGTNKKEFGKVLTKWADTLRNGLDEAKAAAPPSDD